MFHARIEHPPSGKCGTGSRTWCVTTQLRDLLSGLLPEGVCALSNPVQAGFLASFNVWPLSVQTGSRPICENPIFLSRSGPDCFCYWPGSSNVSLCVAVPILGVWRCWYALYLESWILKSWAHEGAANNLSNMGKGGVGRQYVLWRCRRALITKSGPLSGR